MSKQKKVRVDELTVEITYRVSLLDLDIPEDVYKQLEDAFDNGVEVVLNSMQHTDAQEWLSDNCRETDSLGWEAEIYDIVTP